MIFFTSLIVSIIVLSASAHEFASGSNPTPLIELFSSEGCSSCPPAEEQLAELTKNKDLWTKFVPINFHVDYWNQLGWVDPYSNAQFTARQHEYAKSWNVKTVYILAFVGNGSSLGATLNLKNFILTAASAQTPKLIIKIDKKLQAQISATNLDSKKDYILHMVLLGNGLVSKVTSGENKNHTLTQNFVVLNYQAKTLERTGKPNQFLLSGKIKPSRTAIAAWITEKNDMHPLQCLGGYLD